MRVALNTNILAYAEGLNEPDHQKRAASLFDRLSTAEIITPLQALGELLAALTRKAAQSRAAARDSALSWRDGYEIVMLIIETFLAPWTSLQTVSSPFGIGHPGGRR